MNKFYEPSELSEPIKAYKCSICGKLFTSKKKCLQHSKSERDWQDQLRRVMIGDIISVDRNFVQVNGIEIGGRDCEDGVTAIVYGTIGGGSGGCYIYARDRDSIIFLDEEEQNKIRSKLKQFKDMQKIVSDTLGKMDILSWQIEHEFGFKIECEDNIIDKRKFIPTLFK